MFLWHYHFECIFSFDTCIKFLHLMKKCFSFVSVVERVSFLPSLSVLCLPFPEFNMDFSVSSMTHPGIAESKYRWQLRSLESPHPGLLHPQRSRQVHAGTEHLRFGQSETCPSGCVAQDRSSFGPWSQTCICQEAFSLFPVPPPFTTLECFN